MKTEALQDNSKMGYISPAPLHYRESALKGLSVQERQNCQGHGNITVCNCSGLLWFLPWESPDPLQLHLWHDQTRLDEVRYLRYRWQVMNQSGLLVTLIAIWLKSHVVHFSYLWRWRQGSMVLLFLMWSPTWRWWVCLYMEAVH